MDKKIFVVAKREYLERVRSRWFVVITLLVPALMAVAVMFPLYMASRGGASNELRHITIIDVTGAGLGDRVSTALMSDKSLAAGAGPDTVSVRVVNAAPSELADKEKAATAEVKQRPSPATSCCPIALWPASRHGMPDGMRRASARWISSSRFCDRKS
jgi:ABC-2 type transport system permease protein